MSSTVLITADWVGRVIDGRFALHEWLGGSPRGGVFRTDLQQAIPKKAAIKLIPAEGPEADTYLAVWAKIALLSHPHLMKIFRSGRFQFGSIGMVYVVTEYAEEVLAQIIPERPLTPGETREMLDPVLDTLSFLHGKGLVHGHVKPSNIMVVEDQLKLSADNLAATAGPLRRMREQSIYDAPEGFDETFSPAPDVWSLGVTMVEVLTQRLPVWNRSFVDPVLHDGLPPPFADLARDCLRPNPEWRCSLGEIKPRLVPGRPIEFPAGRTSEPEEAEKPRRLLPIALGLIAALVVIGALLLLGHKSGTTPERESAPAATAPSPAPPASPMPAHGPTAKGAVSARTMPQVAGYASSTIRGTVMVVVRATVDESGHVSNASFKWAGPSRYFADRAMIAARGWKFKPALRNGQPVPSEWTIRFQFRRDGEDASAVEDAP